MSSRPDGVSGFIGVESNINDLYTLTASDIVSSLDRDALSSLFPRDLISSIDSADLFVPGYHTHSNLSLALAERIENGDLNDILS